MPVSAPRCILSGVSGTPIRTASAAAANLAVVDELPAQTSRADQIAELRARMAAIGGEVPQQVVEDGDTLAVGGVLSLVLPNGGLPRQAVTHISDTPALIVELIGQVTGAGGRAGIVGWPELSYAGIDADALERVVAVPDAGLDDFSVAGVLAEGLDLVVLRTRSPFQLTPVRARPLLARIRKGQAALVCVNVEVPSPALTVTGRLASFHGIGRGVGRITGIDFDVRAETKGYRPASARVTLGAGSAGGVDKRRLRAVI
ncbi:hypothetical protein CUREI_02000 [Corynebacterium ureicelerivorans]|uniref:Uncharacterized protein n=1 Tax=Corynebacterium ureicelerivorans TaxID=401472 RepID=A0A077HJ24_9CORY|nr:hypothetical protein CUREI_02000 [Corynebacterium ureicelerivorans]